MGRLVVVGMGADGMAGLVRASRDELRRATVVYGSPRQLTLLDDAVTAQRREWPSPMLPALPDLFAGVANAESDVHVVASGDPLLHGIGSTLIRMFGAEAVTVLPHVSSVTLACARLGWSVADTEIISLVTAEVHTAVRRGGQAVVLSRDGTSPGALAGLLADTGRGDSEMTVLERLGAPDERRRCADASAWAGNPPADVDDLNVVAVQYLPDQRAAGALPDEAFAHDSQITKQSVRAITLAALAPRPGEVLWDVGAGSGSVSVEWCRSGIDCTAVAFERDEVRREHIATNVVTFGARVDIRGAAPDSFGDAPDPDVVFIGGGLTQSGVLAACLDRLPAGGRLVANVVTVESEAVLAQWFSRIGGELRRLAHYRGEPVGGFTGWRPAMPVTQWVVTKA